MRTDTLIVLLGISRGIGALLNVVHDCDEVFNYWEPLHYLVHGTGMQTWEYRCGSTTQSFKVVHLVSYNIHNDVEPDNNACHVL